MRSSLISGQDLNLERVAPNPLFLRRMDFREREKSRKQEAESCLAMASSLHPNKAGVERTQDLGLMNPVQVSTLIY